MHARTPLRLNGHRPDGGDSQPAAGGRLKKQADLLHQRPADADDGPSATPPSSLRRQQRGTFSRNAAAAAAVLAPLTTHFQKRIWCVGE